MIPTHDGTADAAFGRVRRQAVLHALLARLLSRSNDLLAYYEVRRDLALHGEIFSGVRAVRVAQIVGSTDRAATSTGPSAPARTSARPAGCTASGSTSMSSTWPVAAPTRKPASAGSAAAAKRPGWAAGTGA